MTLNKNQFSNFMQAQARAILIHKWIESEKAGQDLGNACCMDWVEHHAKAFREEFEKKIIKGEME